MRQRIKNQKRYQADKGYIDLIIIAIKKDIQKNIDRFIENSILNEKK